jgi:hypothetical protein
VATDFLGRWKAKKYFIYGEGAIELDGYLLLHPEGRLSKEQIRRINTTILNQVGPNQDALRYLHRGRQQRLMEIRGKVIEQIVQS